MNKLKTRKSAKHLHGNRLSVLNHNIIIMILIVIITMTGCSLVAAVAGITSAVSETNENTNAKTNEGTNAKNQSRSAKTNEGTNAKNQSRSAKTNKNANAKANENVNANKQPGTNSSQTKDPFISAIINGQTDAVKQQLAAGADVNAKYKMGEDVITPLHAAANWGHADIAKMLIGAGADVNAKTKQGATPLHTAAIKGHADIVKVLIDAGADVNAKASGDVTPLYIAASEGHADIVKVLIAAGADINAKNLSELTPLHEASKGHADAVKALLAAGADVNAKEIHGFTPLHFAAVTAHADIVKNLIDAGADISAMSTERYTPIYLALISKEEGDVASSPKYDDVIKELRAVNDKIDFETNNKDFETALNNFRAQIDTCTDIGKPTREIVEEFESRQMLLCGEPLTPSNWETRLEEIDQKCLSEFFTLFPEWKDNYSESNPFHHNLKDEFRSLQDSKYPGYYHLFTNFCGDKLEDYISGKAPKLRLALYQISQKVVIVDTPDAGENKNGYFYRCFANATIPDVLKTIKDIQDPASEIRRNVEKKKRTKAYANEVENAYQDASNRFDGHAGACKAINILSYNESQQLPIIYGYCNGILAAREGSIQTPNPITPEIIMTEDVYDVPKSISSFRSCINGFNIFHDDYVTSKDYFLKRLQKDQDDYSQEASKIRKNKAAYDKKVNECANLCLLKNKPGSNSYYACMSTCMRAL